MHRLDSTTRRRLVIATNRPLRRRDLHRLGLSDSDIKRLARNGGLHHFGDRYVSGAFESEAARMLCALSAHPGSVFSHFTAAHLSGLRVWTSTPKSGRPVWLTRPAGLGRVSVGPDVVLRQVRIDGTDIWQHRVAAIEDPLVCLDGLPMTTPARTVVDLARHLPLREALVAVDHALETMVTRAELDEVLDRQRGWPGVRRAKAAIALGDPRAESALESIARAVFAEAGIPPPVLQARFWDGHQWMPERTDFWWPQFRTHAEADGLAKFEAASAAERRRLHRAAFHREQRLAARGAELVRFGWEDAVNEPAELVRRMWQAFARGIRRGGGPILWRSEDPATSSRWPRLQPPPDLAAS